MWSDWLVFCECGFSLSALWWRRIRGLWMFPDERDWRRGKQGLVLMGRVMLSKSLIQFSVDGWSCVPSLLFTWGQTMVEVMKIMAISFNRSHACTATLSAPNPVAGHHWPTPPLETPEHSQASLGQSLVGSLLLSPGSWCTRFCLCPPRVYFPVLCKFWQLYVGLMVTSSKRAYAIPTSAAPRAPAPTAVHCWVVPPQEMLKSSSLRDICNKVSLSSIASKPATQVENGNFRLSISTWTPDRLEPEDW